MSFNSTSPAKIFGGSWEIIYDKFLIGAGKKYSVESSGGNAKVTIKGENLPPNTAVVISNQAGKTVSKGGVLWQTVSVSAGNLVICDVQDREIYGYDVYGEQIETPTMPPYLAVYMWRRTA
jgi:hypothetical protein